MARNCTNSTEKSNGLVHIAERERHEIVLTVLKIQWFGTQLHSCIMCLRTNGTEKSNSLVLDSFIFQVVLGLKIRKNPIVWYVE